MHWIQYEAILDPVQVDHWMVVVLPNGLAVVVPARVYAFDRLVMRRTFKFREIKLSGLLIDQFNSIEALIELS